MSTYSESVKYEWEQIPAAGFQNAVESLKPEEWMLLELEWDVQQLASVNFFWPYSVVNGTGHNIHFPCNLAADMRSYISLIF